jgi:hypothetical protein
LISYTVVGVLFGSLGLALNRSFSFGVWQQTATGVAGALMVFVGGIALARQLGWQIRLPRVAGPLERALGGLIRWGKRLSPIRRAAMIGLASSRDRQSVGGRLGDGRLLVGDGADYGRIGTGLGTDLAPISG